MKNHLKITNRKSTFVELKDYCVDSMGPDNKHKGHFLEVTEWSNGDGYDISIYDSQGERFIQLTSGQYKAIKDCIKSIDK